MKVAQLILSAEVDAADIPAKCEALKASSPDLVLVFGDVAFFQREAAVRQLMASFPGATVAGCSTAGEISHQGVTSGQCVITAVTFEKTALSSARTLIVDMDDSFAAGTRIGEQLGDPDLRAVIVLAPGVNINGTALVDGLMAQLSKDVLIVGGLAGDGGAFQQTWTLDGKGVNDRAIVAVGLRGLALSVSHASFGGWQTFGPARKVTRCEGNVLFELDGEPALAVYKRYLGDYAKDLPASGLLFPFAMLGDDHNAVGLIRTILGVDETTGSLTLAGAIEQDGYLKLMHASTNRLVEGAELAAKAAQAMRAHPQDSLGILVSCVGRKLVMGERVDEEVEAVADVLGDRAMLTGFYSYGEISPSGEFQPCRLHNQTMTIAWLGED